MTKYPFGQDENDLLEIPPAERPAGNVADSRFSEIDEADNLLEIPELAFERRMISDTPEESVSQITYEDLPAETRFEEIESAETRSDSGDAVDEAVFQPPVAPDSIAQTARQSGLAYGAAITLFGSVVGLLIIGWIADWLLGTSPWGIVLGIVIGSAIGFFQFFRITSQIFKK